MAKRVLGRLALVGSSLGAASLSGKSILNQEDKQKPSIYDDNVIELVYLDNKPSRLESKIREVRIQTTEQVKEYKSFVQSYVDKFIQLEKKAENCIMNLVPEDEKLLPNGLYVGIAALYGSILARNSFFLIRFASPLTFFISSSYFLLPGTTKNTGNRILDLYKQNENLFQFPNLNESKTESTKEIVTSPELNSNDNKESNVEKTIKEVEAMYTTRGDPGVRPALERKEANQ